MNKFCVMPATVGQLVELFLLPRGGFLLAHEFLGLFICSGAVGGHGLSKGLHPILVLGCQRAGGLRGGPGSILKKPDDVARMWIHDIESTTIGLHIVMVLAEAGQVRRSGRATVRVVDAVVLLADRGRAIAAGVAAGLSLIHI